MGTECSTSWRFTTSRLSSAHVSYVPDVFTRRMPLMLSSILIRVLLICQVGYQDRILLRCSPRLAYTPPSPAMLQILKAQCAISGQYEVTSMHFLWCTIGPCYPFGSLQSSRELLIPLLEDIDLIDPEVKQRRRHHGQLCLTWPTTLWRTVPYFEHRHRGLWCFNQSDYS